MGDPRKLGKGDYRHDDRTLQLGKYLQASPPAAVDWSQYVKGPWGVMLNTTIGDCAIACPGHLIMLWTASAGKEVVPADSDILAAYEAVSGYDPRTGANDNGCVVLDVLKYWQTRGIAGHKIAAYAEVDHSNLDEVRSAVNLFGGLDIGVRLPLAAQSMGNHWVAPPANSNDEEPWWERFFACAKRNMRKLPGVNRVRALQDVWAPGSWGGHCVALVGYDTQKKTFTVVSWGELVTVDEGFMEAYADEFWAVLSEDILNPSTGKDVQGLDMEQLRADLAKIT